ncbi:MAG: roadblock/LC7 domain-containing protein [Desulfuromonadaceae bacterium]|jgi:predicted regulator of Ras-like GTPase activity (Roadblock/LC7/MglB family)
MAFKRILEQLMDAVPGAYGAILADWEGEAVDQAGCMDDYELKVIGAHKGIIYHNLRDAVQRLDGSELREVVLVSTEMRVVVLPVTPEYFLVLALRRNEVLGRALFEARRSVVQLRDEIG